MASFTHQDLLPSLPYTHTRALELVRLAESAGRPNDMCAAMRCIVDDATAQERVLSPEERLMFSVSFKNRLSPLRGCLKMLALVEEHETDPQKLACVRKYAAEIEDSICVLADEVLGLIGDKQSGIAERDLSIALDDAAAGAKPSAAVDAPAGAAANTSSPSQSSAAMRVAYAVDALIYCQKLAADYCRYVAEAHSDSEVLRRHSDLALMLYSKASAHAAAHLHPAHPTRLGVLLNFSVFLFEVRHCETEAYEVGYAGLTEALDALAAAAAAREADKATPLPLTSAELHDSEAVQRLLRENMGVWKQVILVQNKGTVPDLPPAPQASLAAAAAAAAAAPSARAARKAKLQKQQQQQQQQQQQNGSSDVGREAQTQESPRNSSEISSSSPRGETSNNAGQPEGAQQAASQPLEASSSAQQKQTQMATIEQQAALKQSPPEQEHLTTTAVSNTTGGGSNNADEPGEQQKALPPPAELKAEPLQQGQEQPPATPAVTQ